MTKSVVRACVEEFQKIKRMGEWAIAQLDDEQLHVRINPQQNSAAVVMQHVAGNLISRWTDFLTSDGEKPWRDRESEFGDRQMTRAELMALWEKGWGVLFEAVGGLTDADLGRTVYIRKEPHTVFEAINRQTSHYSVHMGQLLVIAKHLCGEKWKYLTIPPGKSAEFNKGKGL